MIKLIFLITLLMFASCASTTTEKKESKLNTNNFCPNDSDSLVFGTMEPFDKFNSVIGFVDVLECHKRIENDSLILEIHMREIPDSIIINNPNIGFGYSEFGLDIVFRNKSDSVKMNNISFNISYFKPDSTALPKTISFNDYLKKMDHSIIRELMKNIEGTEKAYLEILGENSNISVLKIENTIKFSYPKSLICDYIEDYLCTGFYVKTSYNNSTIKGENNFITRTVSSIDWVHHYYLPNSSRKVK